MIISIFDRAVAPKPYKSYDVIFSIAVLGHFSTSDAKINDTIRLLEEN
jgi:hypothetical protein